MLPSTSRGPKVPKTVFQALFSGFRVVFLRNAFISKKLYISFQDPKKPLRLTISISSTRQQNFIKIDSMEFLRKVGKNGVFSTFGGVYQGQLDYTEVQIFLCKSNLIWLYTSTKFQPSTRFFLASTVRFPPFPPFSWSPEK